MPPATVHLPNTQTLTVTPVFGGLSFKANDLNIHSSAFPPGWTIILRTEEGDDDYRVARQRRPSPDLVRNTLTTDHHKELHTHRFTKPTLHNDCLFISSISIPSSSDFKPVSSPTRQIAMMLWATLWWYFHQPEPNAHIMTEASSHTPNEGRPKADWRIKIKKEGIFKGKNLLQKLERMGLISSEDSCVGIDTDSRNPSGWAEMFISRKSFWQIDARIFLFTLSPAMHSPFPSSSPYPSRPGSPSRQGDGTGTPRSEAHGSISAPASNEALSKGADVALSQGLWNPGSPGPFQSGSHLPTYFPPAPPQYTFTNNIRHPIRSKPPRQGETFYIRYVPSVDQYLSFRVPTLSKKPPPQFGHLSGSGSMLPPYPTASANSGIPTLASFADRQTDLETLHKWMNNDRVNAAWGAAGPMSTQEQFLKDGLSSRHSFPVIGCWDGKPFGYFEVYWVKEDKFGALLGGEVGSWDRGLHVLVGEEEFRGPHRVKVWLSALVHYCWLADPRTQKVCLEPRVDNTKLVPSLSYPDLPYAYLPLLFVQGRVASPEVRVRG
jgi:N5-hydroxyornithine acetyltransferase